MEADPVLTIYIKADPLLKIYMEADSLYYPLQYTTGKADPLHTADIKLISYKFLHTEAEHLLTFYIEACPLLHF